ncbi:MAG: TetR family transcriptional regulator [Deltaproteobacteria bacterium]|nr:TetR family transcriptional regulator [Deltaproteobacteria bacterium]
MNKTKEDAEKTRQNILDTALLIFSRRGYRGTRLEDVAKQAGVTRGAIYWHFRDKFDLYDTLLRDGYASYYERIAAILNADESPLSRIRRLFVETFVFSEDDEKYRAVEEIRIFKSEAIDEMKRSMQKMATVSKFLRQAVATLIREGIKAGEIKSGIDPDLAALSLVSHMSGVVITWMRDPQSFSIKGLAEDLVDYQLSPIVRE